MIPSVTNTDGEYSEDELSDVEDSNDMDVMTGQFFSCLCLCASLIKTRSFTSPKAKPQFSFSFSTISLHLKG